MDASIYIDKLEKIENGVFEEKDLVKGKWSNSCSKVSGMDLFTHL